MRIPGRDFGPTEVPVTDYQRHGDMLTVNEAIQAGHASVVDVKHPYNNEIETFTPEAQLGVRMMEATTTVWTLGNLILAYVLIWVIVFVDSLQQQATNQLTPYVTSGFKQHNLTAYTGVMAAIFGGVLKLPLAKILDIFGRTQGFALVIMLLVVGLIIMAACKDVQTYAAAQVFYWIGYNGLTYVMGIFVADTSSLKSRGFMFAYITSPYIATVWASGPLATRFVHGGAGYRWFFGIFAIATLVTCAPLYVLFWWNYRKAVKAGIIEPVKSDRTFLEAVKYYALEFDVGGLILIMSGLVLFLLPFNIYSFQDDGWRSPSIIAMFISGCVVLVIFTLYEKYVAIKTFVPYRLLMDRTVAGACVLATVLFVSWYIWHSWFISFLQVVSGLSITQATYVSNIYNLGSCFFSLVVGVLIRWTGRFKWIALYIGVPLTVLGVGLIIRFRQPDVSIGYIIMCQIFIAFGGGATVITEQIAVMAATDHQMIAVIYAIENMCASIGGGIGSSIATAIWTAVFPSSLYEHLPEDAKGNFTLIYVALDNQLSYPKGSPVRIAIELAYGDAQKWMNIGGLVALAFAIPAVMIWRDIRVRDFKQVKGRVI